MGASNKRVVAKQGYCPTQSKQEKIEITYAEITTLSSPNPQYKELQMYCPHVSLSQGNCEIYNDCPIKNNSQGSPGRGDFEAIKDKIKEFITRAEQIETQDCAKRNNDHRLIISGNDFEKWKNELQVFITRNLGQHELYDDALRIIEFYKTKPLKSLSEAVGLLESIHGDEEFFMRKDVSDNSNEAENYRMLETGLPRNTHELIMKIVKSDNPADMLAKQFEGLSFKEDEILRGVLRELQENGFINTMWADNVPYIVTVNNSARTYTAEYETEEEMGAKRMVKSKDVFIVHGHDDEALIKTENFVRKMGLNPIVLRDQASMGKTIIEKIETYTDVGFAIVLYTPCDEIKDNTFRARQNVVLEHGYLMSKIGRHYVAPIIRGNVETPGDISGVVYIQMDAGKDWEQKLVKELQAAGYNADANKI